MPLYISHFQPPRSPLARILAAIGGLVLLSLLFVVGTIALAIVLVAGAVWLLWFRWRIHRFRKQQAKQGNNQAQSPWEQPTHKEDVIEGEYIVVDEDKPR